MNFLKKVKLFITHNDELTEFLESQKEAKELQRIEERRNNLHLCFAHKQRYVDHYHSEDDCQYCQLEKQNLQLINELEGQQC